MHRQATSSVVAAAVPLWRSALWSGCDQHSHILSMYPSGTRCKRNLRQTDGRNASDPISFVCRTSGRRATLDTVSPPYSDGIVAFSGTLLAYVEKFKHDPPFSVSKGKANCFGLCWFMNSCDLLCGLMGLIKFLDGFGLIRFCFSATKQNSLLLNPATTKSQDATCKNWRLKNARLKMSAGKKAKLPKWHTTVFRLWTGSYFHIFTSLLD